MDETDAAFWVWWEPPEIGDPDEFPEGMWVIGRAQNDQGDFDGMPTNGRCLGAGPVGATVGWLAARCGCEPDALVRREDFEVGILERQPGRSLDYDRVDRWITCRRYTVAASAISDAKKNELT